MKKLHVLVLGESFVDIFISGPSFRCSPESGAPVILNPTRTTYEGGAKNTANNLGALGALVDMTTNSQELRKTRVQLGSTDVARIDEETSVQPMTEIHGDMGKYDAIVFSHYNKGFLTRKFVQTVIQNATSMGILTFADTRPEDFEWFKDATLVKMDGRAAAFTWPENVVVTAGSEGAYTYEPKTQHPTQEVYPAYVAGAGDSFVAGLVMKYLRTKNLRYAVQYANKVARVAVARPGISIVHASDT